MSAFSGIKAANLAPKNPQSKTERANLYILAHPAGATELDILNNAGLISGRNYFTNLEREYFFKFNREKIPNSDGIGGHYKYSYSSLDIAEIIIKAVNKSRIHRKLAEFTPEQKSELLKPINHLLGN
ncbi:hypothetical protein [Pseudoalteromonas sp. APC 3691]|uniref:hypothetical protein n=1 Tax=Pseudoalteromonas sp. APC 3691 TaxID=3035173 RepID=UPI0025B4693A|nr:hypothetical protein [Pseudoalteromonas sp. APC 3691]MDN3390160.1 hypothetical protein [Pseudoalteromonas sp. APC 3691]